MSPFSAFRQSNTYALVGFNIFVQTLRNSPAIERIYIETGYLRRYWTVSGSVARRLNIKSRGHDPETQAKLDRQQNTDKGGPFL